MRFYIVVAASWDGVEWRESGAISTISAHSVIYANRCWRRLRLNANRKGGHYNVSRLGDGGDEVGDGFRLICGGSCTRAVAICVYFRLLPHSTGGVLRY